MSYRSFKRVLGETSLERKCRFLFGACLLVLIAGSFWWYGKKTEKLVYKQNRNKGQLLVDTLLVNYHWDKWDEVQKLGEFRDLVNALGGQLQNQQYSSSFIGATDSGGKRKPQDEFEWKVLKQFVKARSDFKVVPEGTRGVDWDERDLPKTGDYEYFQPIRAKKMCVYCHTPPEGEKPIEEGDLIAVAKVKFNNGPTLADMNWNWAILISTAIITVFLAMVASYIIVRYVIVKPLKHLRDVSDAVSHGNIEQRAEIRTGDEFEELGVAFNRMLRHLVAVQEELRQVNGNLDLKVDELAQANMRLFEMNRLKSDFLATMSHELRTPLNSIIGFSDVLGSAAAMDDKQQRYVRNIQKSGRMLLDMINDILDLAKIESGKMEIRLSDFRIDHVIGAQCDMARPLTEKKNIDLEEDIEPNLPQMHQDQGKVQQVLNNLLSNAIKFTPEGGRIVVTAQRSPAAEIVLTVADTGVGISEEDQQNIFEKFRQGRIVAPAGDAMTREFSGTGLGLSIVKELCKLLGGSVSLESQLGKGSTFMVRLPWILADQPKLDSPLADALEELTKPRRIDFERTTADALATSEALP